MILGVDGNEANVKEKVGVSWCVWNQLKQLQKVVGRVKPRQTWLKRDELDTNLATSNVALSGNNIKENQQLYIRVFVKDTPNSEMPEENEFYKYVVIPKKTLWSQIDLPLALFTKHRDLDYFLSPAHYAPRFCPCPTIVIVHDLSYFYYPQDFLKKDLYQLEKWTGYSVKKAKYVIAVSQKTKADLINNYALPEDKIKVVYNGYTKGLSPQGLKSVSAPHFVFIGTLQPRKNLFNLIEAFARFSDKHPEYLLYLIGKKGWLYENLFASVYKRHLEKKIIFTGYITEEKKRELLQSAAALIMPGVYEGFGLPILEAFENQVPVLAASAGALPETGGRACLYFSPKDTQEIIKAMEKIIVDRSLREELIKKGKEQLSQFSWQKNIQEILKLLS